MVLYFSRSLDFIYLFIFSAWQGLHCESGVYIRFDSVSRIVNTTDINFSFPLGVLDSFKKA